MSYNILIVEDEHIARQQLIKKLNQLLSDIQYTECTSVAEAVDYFEAGNNPHLCFFDIQLSDGISFQIFDFCKVLSPVIFITAFDEYAIKAFKVNSIDYLLKPLIISDLENAINKWKSGVFQIENRTTYQNLNSTLNFQNKAYKSRFLIKIGSKFVPISIEDIFWFYVSDGGVYAVDGANSRYLIDYTLDEIEAMVDPKLFFRLNRKFLNHSKSIKKLTSQLNGKLNVEIFPSPLEDVTVSRDKSSIFKNWLDQ
jgi:DNA-binding LytR/AlgR family response regulator